MNLTQLKKRAAANRKRAKGALEAKSTRKNIKVVYAGIKFDSKAECRRYQQLELLQSAGKIQELKCHPHLKLCVNCTEVTRYTPDFQYLRAGKWIFEDVKGKLEEAAWVRIRLARALEYPIRLLTQNTNPDLWQRERQAV